jgi:hypothetical protein
MLHDLFAGVRNGYFALAMIFALLANACVFLILYRMKSLGFRVGIWRTGKDFQLYSGYWNIAPKRGWSRLPFIVMVASFGAAVIFLFLSAKGY